VIQALLLGFMVMPHLIGTLARLTYQQPGLIENSCETPSLF
jgi:hypothetical protein